MNNIVDYFVPAHDPILGIKSVNVVNQLDPDNWHSKAITFQEARSSHYVYLCQASCARERKRYYCVNTYDIDTRTTRSKTLFHTLGEALAFANQGAALSLNTARGC